jgi:hypothetical protein
MLNAYITQVQRLLHDAQSQFWSPTELTTYINAARTRLVRDTGCYRNLQNIYLSTGVEVYPFGGVTGFIVTNGGSGYTSAPAVTVSSSGVTGSVQATAVATVTSGTVSSIQVVQPGTYYSANNALPVVSFTGGGGTNAAATATFIDQQTIDCVNMTVYWGNTRRTMARWDWSSFNTKARGWVQYLGLPSVFSIYSYVQAYVAKIPDQTYQVDFDSVIQPPALVTDSTLEVIPIVMQDPIQYFAAHLAKMKTQRWDEVDRFYARYNVEVIKAINSSFTRAVKYPYAGQ